MYTSKISADYGSGGICEGFADEESEWVKVRDVVLTKMFTFTTVYGNHLIHHFRVAKLTKLPKKVVYGGEPIQVRDCINIR